MGIVLNTHLSYYKLRRESVKDYKALNTINDFEGKALAIYAGQIDTSDGKFLNIIFNIETAYGYIEISELFIDINTTNINISIGSHTIISGEFRSFVEDMHTEIRKKNQNVQKIENYYISTEISDNNYIFLLSLKK